MSSRPRPNKITVYYDGRCPMCSGIMDRVRASENSGAFDLRDMHKGPKMPFSAAAVEREMHVVDQDGVVYKGAAAIFMITEQYPRLRTATRFARLPPIMVLAPPVYGLVAANRRFIVGPASRLFWLKVIVITAFCIGLALSPHLWAGPRSFPPIPISNLLPALDGWVAQAMLAALFVLAAPILLSPKPQKFIAGFLAIIVVFCLLDQTRLQPWVFQYGFLLAVLALFTWQSDDVAGQRRTLNIARLVVAGTYVFSGLQKLNWNFVDNDFPWIVQPIAKVFLLSTGAVQVLGICAPFVQIAFGAGLLARRFRRVSLVLAVAMHVFILAMFGPFGHDWNNVVWPWTAAMAVFDILLFAGAEFSPRDVIWSNGHHLHRAALLLFAMLPALSFFNLWDSYLSSALYSGNLNEAVIYLSDAGRRALPSALGSRAVHTSANTNVLNVQRWAIEDLNVMPYPETRVYKSIAKTVCGALSDSGQLVLIVREQRLFFSRPERGYRCGDL